MKSEFKLIVLLFVLFAFTACKEDLPKPPLALIDPPIPALNMAFASYDIDAIKGGEVSYSTGTTLKIPANAFVDSAGKPVSGMVQLQYREFHDAVDIFLSGIPMNYDSAGSEGALTTAGMFEVKAMQNNQPLRLADGKKIPIQMASFQTGNEYNFYTLNEENRSWEFKGKPTVEENSKRVEWLEKSEKMKPSRAFPYDNKKTFVFNYYNLLDIYYKDDWKKIREHSKDRGLEKKIGTYGVNVHDTDIIKGNVKYKGTDYFPTYMVWETTGTNIPKWAKSDQAKASVMLVRGNVYRFSATSKDGKSFSTDIRMLMPIQYLLRFSADYWKKNYDTAMAKAEEEARKARMLSETFRSFEVPSLGIHNYDFFTRNEDYVTLNATFDFGLKQEKEALDADAVNRVYFVSADGRTIVRFDRDKWETFKIAPQEGGRLFTILPDKKLSLFSAEEYANLPFGNWKQNTTEANTHNFQFESQSKTIESAWDIHQLLNIPAENPQKEEGWQ